MLPHTLVDPLRHNLVDVRRLHQQDLARKYPNAASEWGWQWVFPQHLRWHDPRESRAQGRVGSGDQQAGQLP